MSKHPCTHWSLQIVRKNAHQRCLVWDSLGVKLKTRHLYASSGNGAESFYTGSVASTHSVRFAAENEQNGKSRPDPGVRLSLPNVCSRYRSHASTGRRIETTFDVGQFRQSYCVHVIPVTEPKRNVRDADYLAVVFPGRKGALSSMRRTVR